MPEIPQPDIASQQSFSNQANFAVESVQLPDTIQLIPQPNIINGTDVSLTDEVPPEIIEDKESAIEFAETRMIIGAFAVASSHLVEGNAIEDIPEYRSHKFDGFREEMSQNKNSQQYMKDYLDEGIKLAELLYDAGDKKLYQELLDSIAYNLSKDGNFRNAIEESVISNEQIYRLLAATAKETENNFAPVLATLTGKKAYGYVVETNEQERISSNDMLDKAKNDPDQKRGLLVAAMYARTLANGLVNSQKNDANKLNEGLLKKAIGIFGFDESQSEEVYRAMVQSYSNEKHGVDIDPRVEQATALFIQLRETLGSNEKLKLSLQKLYKDFGIRNFHRYSEAGILPQLKDDFVPEEIVITAFWDKWSALSKPENSAQGLEYKKPAYFEAKDDLELAKSLIRAHRMAKKPLGKVLIRAHGSSTGFTLSEKEMGRIDTAKIDKRATDSWERQMLERGVVSKDLELIFESCSLGAGGFPQSLFEKTGIFALTSPKNITGSAIEGAPGVMRVNGEVKFGIGQPINGKRDPEELASPVLISR